MPRNRASAKKAGTQFERQIADALALHIDDRIDRRVKTGTKDKGDIAGLRMRGHRIVIECKNCATQSLPAWTREAHLEAHNDDALAGLVIHKRHRNNNPLDQWVTMTVADLIALITEIPPPLND
ncbi:hypothetical protein CH304_00335 [Rhodococcus sp. 15-649-1-2]|nr:MULTISPECIES: hypothetical protein [unclassified Rhodococcus (in: high G+C Gram-positive bacteria)]OZC62338.1 hypothetical protein CH267_02035 [Rhodococcus sp. 06-621-2]OZE88052.1 hypothetical protein CH304_00335 [Rhodococcus sp. 15-649-1-2]